MWEITIAWIKKKKKKGNITPFFHNLSSEPSSLLQAHSAFSLHVALKHLLRAGPFLHGTPVERPPMLVAVLHTA